MRRWVTLWISVGLVLPAPAAAHEIADGSATVIDTDMGLDDAVTLAMALQSPRERIVSIVACEGVAGRDTGIAYVERMVALFNRGDIALYAPVRTGAAKSAPAFRAFAEQAVSQALPGEAKRIRRPFAADAYVSEGGPTVVLVLGPLTNLAAALRDKPAIKDGIAHVVVAGGPEAATSWNAGFDPEALAAVKASGVSLTFVVGGEAARKPACWRAEELAFGAGTSIGEQFVRRLLADARVRRHYMERFASFHDELVFLYYAEAGLFSGSAEGKGVVAAKDGAGITGLFVRLIEEGRQRKDRVVFVDGVLPNEVFRKEVRQRKAGIIAKNGEVEWFAQILMNELHEHLGAYSVIGVKMGLRAAELLNAPQHGMRVVSHTAARPPVSCLNDGIIVSTGCTPGRGLFRHDPGPPGSAKVTFEYNGRRITLAIKQAYRERIRAKIKSLLDKHKLEDPAYWDGVRRFGLNIWEHWHRRELFDVVDAGVESER